MPSPATPRVFISYSSKDTEIVGRVRAALADAGVAVWLDHEQLIPGTPDWRAAVLRGIAQATTVIYVASPDAALSKYVAHELAIAEGEGKTILPFWIRGDKWYFCAPFGLYVAQHIDGRDASYAAGLAKLLATLGAAPTPATPATPAANAPAPQQPQGGRVISPGHHAATPQPTRAPANAPAPQSIATPSKSGYPNAVPERLASLGVGFRVATPQSAPAIVPPLVSVAAGPFLMGSDKRRDPQALDDEMPQHRLELAAFQIGKYPVTVAEYALAVYAGAVREPPAMKPFEFPGKQYSGVYWQAQLHHLDHPVVCVSWQDAMAYLKWLREATGEPGWRLPTEAEWEKAARWDAQRNASRIYPWGDSFDPFRCNTEDSGAGHTTTPVGSYPANDARHSGASPWGAEDMAGNVWEWTSSLYKPYPFTIADGRDAPDPTENRVLRGSSWGDFASKARAAYRDNVGPDLCVSSCGFRLALSVPVGG